MTDLEWTLLDNVYLMSDYNTLRESTGVNGDEFNAALIGVLQRGWLRQLIYNAQRNDYEDIEPFDPLQLHEAHYVISKNGLIAHTGSL